MLKIPFIHKYILSSLPKYATIFVLAINNVTQQIYLILIYIIYYFVINYNILLTIVYVVHYNVTMR